MTVIALLMELFSIAFLMALVFSVVASIVSALRAVPQGRRQFTAQRKQFSDAALNQENNIGKVA